MADQLCGPSNALQNFQKHSSADRTLQQDRLTSRASPSQGFRSSPGPQSGLVNHDFEAFQAGLPLQEPLTHGFAQHAPPQMSQPGPMAWANDFQRMSLSSPAPQIHQQAAQQSAQAAWHQEFLRQSQQSGPSQIQHQNYNAPLERLSTIVPMGGSSYQPMYNGGMMANQYQDQTQQPQIQQPAEAFDEEAFARAFDEAAQTELATQQAEGLKDEVMLDESAERLLERDPAQDQAKIGADLIHDPDGKPNQHQELQQDPDALSRTAAELLHRVKDNQSEKFQNSNFLQLMRQFRDKEVTVEGDKIVGYSDSVEYETRQRLEHSNQPKDSFIADHNLSISAEGFVNANQHTEFGNGLSSWRMRAQQHNSNGGGGLGLHSGPEAVDLTTSMNEQAGLGNMQRSAESAERSEAEKLRDYQTGLLTLHCGNKNRKMMYRAVEIPEGATSLLSGSGETSTMPDNHALKDYKLQLELLEQQNKRRLMEARMTAPDYVAPSEPIAAAKAYNPLSGYEEQLKILQQIDNERITASRRSFLKDHRVYVPSNTTAIPHFTGDSVSEDAQQSTRSLEHHPNIVMMSQQQTASPSSIPFSGSAKPFAENLPNSSAMVDSQNKVQSEERINEETGTRRGSVRRETDPLIFGRPSRFDEKQPMYKRASSTMMADDPPDSVASISILSGWLNSRGQLDSRPTVAELVDLVERTGLQPNQILTYLDNMCEKIRKLRDVHNRLSEQPKYEAIVPSGSNGTALRRMEQESGKLAGNDNP